MPSAAIASQNSAMIFSRFTPADLGDVLEGLSRDERSTVLLAFGDELAAEILVEVEGVVLEDVLEHLDDQVISENLGELNSDDAIDLLEDLDEVAKQKILSSLSAAKRWAAEDALRYPEFSTGRLMAREFVTVPADWNVGQTIDFLRAEPDLPDDFYDIYLVDEAYRPIGSVRSATSCARGGKKRCPTSPRVISACFRRCWTKKSWPTHSANTVFPRRQLPMKKRVGWSGW